MTTPVCIPGTDDRDDDTERREFPEVVRGKARVMALHLVEPVSVTLLVGDKLVSFGADDAMLERALRLRGGEHAFSAIKVPGERPKLLRLDPEDRPRPTSDEVAAYVATRWAETLRRLGEGAA